MTREEAIRIIETVFQDEYVYKYYDSITHQALDMAIEALTYQNPTEPNNTCEVDLISRQDALKPFCISPDGTRIPEVDCDNFPVEFSVEFIKKHLLSLPSTDAVSKGVVEQFRWERDVAMAQLEEYGIPFGTNKDEDVVRVIRCKDCIHYESDGGAMMICNITDMVCDNDDYCSYGERREE